MKKRTFYTTLILFLLFINIVLYVLANMMLEDRLKGVKERSLSSHYAFTSMIGKDMAALEEKGSLNEENLRKSMRQYSSLLDDPGLTLALYKEEDVIFQNGGLSEKTQKKLRQNLLSAENGYRYMGFLSKGDPIFYIIGNLDISVGNYRILYGNDISNILAEWKTFRFRLFTGGAIFSGVLGIFLLSLLQHIFRPLGQIALISGQIAEGQYEKRLSVKGGDELADMARSFNNMADKIQSQILELDAAARQKQEFIDNFAHELKTPLTAIYGYAEYLQKAAVTEDDRQEATEYIMSEAQRVQKMAKQLMDLVMLRENEFAREDIDLKLLFDRVRFVMHHKAKKKNISITYRDAGACLEGNAELLEHLLTNLIANAIQYCEAEGEVCVTAAPVENGMCITVEDDGQGINDEELEHITAAFYRVDKSRSREEGGAGLGLAICSKIAEIHGARMEFTSSEGVGTRVCIYFTTS